MTERTWAGEAAGAAGVAAGASLLAPSMERALGVQRFLHGTSGRAGERILAEGLLTQFGGGPTGSSAAIGRDAYRAASKGRVHVAKDSFLGKRFVASPHASLSDAFARSGGALTPADIEKAWAEGIVFGPRKGALIGGALPYEEFMRVFEQDPDQVPGHAFRGRQSIPPHRLRRGHAGVKDIVGARPKDLWGYIRRHPGRFSRGVGGLGLSIGLAGGGVHLLTRRLREQGGDPAKTSSSQRQTMMYLADRLAAATMTKTSEDGVWTGALLGGAVGHHAASAAYSRLATITPTGPYDTVFDVTPGLGAGVRQFDPIELKVRRFNPVNFSWTNIPADGPRPPFKTPIGVHRFPRGMVTAGGAALGAIGGAGVAHLLARRRGRGEE